MNNEKIKYFVTIIDMKISALIKMIKYIVNIKRVEKKIGIIFCWLFSLIFILKLPVVENYLDRIIKPILDIVLVNIKVAGSKFKMPEILYMFFPFIMILVHLLNPKKLTNYLKFIFKLSILSVLFFYIGIFISNPYNTINILNLVVVLIVLDIFNRAKDIEFKKMKSTIFSSRHDKSRYLEQLVNDNNKNLILIDGKWGIGKTYFIESTVENNFKYDYVIKIDVLLFNDRNHMIDYTLNEINSVLIREGIRTNTLKKYGKLIRTVSDKMPLNLDVFLNPLSVEEIEKNIEKHLNQLNKRIFIIVDNVERIIEEPKKIDILGFLHKIYDLKDEKINIIVLADSSKLIGFSITKEYLDKFFINKIELKSLDKYEILDSFFIDKRIKKEIYENIHEVYLEFDLKLKKLLGENKVKNEVFNKVISRWKKLDEHLENPRNIEHIIANINEKYSQDNHIISKKYSFDEVEYFKTIVLVEVYRSVIDENVFNLTVEDLLKGFSKVNSKNDLDFYNYFLTLTFFWGKINELDARNKYLEVKARAIMKIIMSLEKSEEAKIIKKSEYFLFENVARWTDEIDSFIPSFIEYSEYLDSNENAIIIYRNMLRHKMHLLKNKELILNYKIFELDKENSETEKSILEILTFDISYKSRIEELLINSYQNEIFHFVRTKYNIYKTSNDLKKFVITIYNRYEQTEFLDFFDVIKEIIRKTTEKKYEIIIKEFVKMIKKYEMISYENNYDLEYEFKLIYEKTVEWKKSLNLLEESGTINHFEKEWTEFNEIKKMIENTFLELWDVTQKSFYRIKINDTVEILENFINSLDSIFFKIILETIPDNENVIKLFNLDIVSTLIGSYEYFDKNIYKKIEKVNLASTFQDKYEELKTIKKDLEEIIKNEKEEIVLLLIDKIQINILDKFYDVQIINHLKSYLLGINSRMKSNIQQRIM